MRRSDIPPHLVKYFKPRRVYKPKDDANIPHMAYGAMMADGWYGRCQICWNKPNPMPSSVTDRPTISHEYMLLFSKKPRYYFDQEAVREKYEDPSKNGGPSRSGGNKHNVNHDGSTARLGPGERYYSGRNIRSVWTIATRPYPGSHYATFPPDLVYPCVKAGTSEKGVCGECGAPWARVVEDTGERIQVHWAPGTQDKIFKAGHKQGANSVLDSGELRVKRTAGWQPSCTHEAQVVPPTVLDPFMGSGTTALAARKLGRRSVGFDLDERNLKLIEQRLGYQEVLL